MSGPSQAPSASSKLPNKKLNKNNNPPPMSSFSAKKRKTPAAEENGTTSDITPSNHSKRPKTKNKKNPTARDTTRDALLDTDHSVNTIFAKMDPDLLADYIAAQTKRFGEKDGLSVVELGDLYVPAGAIYDTTVGAAAAAAAAAAGVGEEKVRTEEHLAGFLDEVILGGGEAMGEREEEGKGKQKGKKGKGRGGEGMKCGAPRMIIVTGAGMRAADLVRAARKVKRLGTLPVAKLWAKHLKVAEQVEFLKKNKTAIAVGTPARLMELADNGALLLDALETIVIDASYINQKKLGIMDMQDTMMPLAKWLTRGEFKERYGSEEKPLKLLFY